MKRIVLGIVFSVVLVAAVAAAPDLHARTTDGRDVVLHADRTWRFAGEGGTRRRINLTSLDVPLGVAHIAQIAPWLLDEAVFSSGLRIELLPTDGDIADLVLYQAVEPSGAAQTVIRLRVHGEGGSQVGISP